LIVVPLVVLAILFVLGVGFGIVVAVRTRAEARREKP
jgi:hypothetical protein